MQSKSSGSIFVEHLEDPCPTHAELQVSTPPTFRNALTKSSSSMQAFDCINNHLPRGASRRASMPSSLLTRSPTLSPHLNLCPPGGQKLFLPSLVRRLSSAKKVRRPKTSESSVEHAFRESVSVLQTISPVLAKKRLSPRSNGRDSKKSNILVDGTASTAGPPSVGKAFTVDCKTDGLLQLGDSKHTHSGDSLLVAQYSITSNDGHKANAGSYQILDGNLSAVDERRSSFKYCRSTPASPSGGGPAQRLCSLSGEPDEHVTTDISNSWTDDICLSTLASFQLQEERASAPILPCTRSHNDDDVHIINVFSKSISASTSQFISTTGFSEVAKNLGNWTARPRAHRSISAPFLVSFGKKVANLASRRSSSRDALASIVSLSGHVSGQLLVPLNVSNLPKPNQSSLCTSPRISHSSSRPCCYCSISSVPMCTCFDVITKTRKPL